LEYRAHISGLRGDAGVDIAVALIDGKKDVTIWCHPEWEKHVLVRDKSYVQDLLSDMANRVQKDPFALYQQLSSLSIGVLVTSRMGVFDSTHMRLPDRYANFVRVK
jgi:hypothetical protein